MKTSTKLLSLCLAASLLSSPGAQAAKESWAEWGAKHVKDWVGHGASEGAKPIADKMVVCTDHVLDSTSSKAWVVVGCGAVIAGGVCYYLYHKAGAEKAKAEYYKAKVKHMNAKTRKLEEQDVEVASIDPRTVEVKPDAQCQMKN